MKKEIKVILAVILCSLVVRFFLFSIQGYKVDLSTFSAWFYTAANYGPQNFYEAAGWCDYPPFNVYIFWIFGSLAKWLSLFGTNLLFYVIKLPSNLFDISTAFLIFIFLRGKTDFKSSLISTAFYAFNPATIFNTAVWGQYDAIYTFFLISSLILILNSKPKLSAIALTLGVLTKPQSIALAPLIFVLIFKKYGWKGLATSVLVSAISILVVIIPLNWNNPISFLVDIYFGGYSGYPYTSMYAFNIWALFGFWVSDAGTLLLLDFFTMGWIMFGTLSIFSIYNIHKRLDNSDHLLILFSAFILLFGFFMLPTRIHERYLFPAFSVLVLLLPFFKESRRIYGVLTCTYLFNQAYILSFLNNDSFITGFDIFVWVVTLINLVAFTYSLFVLVKKIRSEDSRIKGDFND